MFSQLSFGGHLLHAMGHSFGPRVERSALKWYVLKRSGRVSLLAIVQVRVLRSFTRSMLSAACRCNYPSSDGPGASLVLACLIAARMLVGEKGSSTGISMCTHFRGLIAVALPPTSLFPHSPPARRGTFGARYRDDPCSSELRLGT